MAPSPVSKRFKLLFVSAIGVICALIIYKGILHKTILTQTGFHVSPAFHSEKLSECRSVCTTYDCLYMANEIMRKMNSKVNPCEDFYSFACGGLEESIGPYRNYSMFTKQEELMYAVIRDVIEKSSGSAGSPEEKLKNVYESCMNEETSDMKSVQTLLQFLSEIGISNWPNLNSNFTFENPSLEDVLGTLFSYKEAVFFTFNILRFSKFRETGIKNLTINQGYNYQNKLLNPEEMKIVVPEILSHLDMEILNASQIVEDYIEVDTGIQALRKENDEKTCSRSNRTKCTFVDCTEEKASGEALICNVLKSAVQSTRAESVVNTEGYKICCPDSFYIQNIVSLMSCHTHRALANYMALRVFMNNFEYLKFSLRMKLRSFFEVKSVHFDSPRSFEMNKRIFCIQFLTRYMPYNVGLIFARKVFPGNSAEGVNDIFKEVKSSVINYIYQQDWIGEAQKKYLSDSMIKIRSEFNDGVVEMNEAELNTIYERFEFTPRKNSFFHNVLECKRVATSAEYSGLLNYELHKLPFEASADTGGNISVGIGLLLPFFYLPGFDNVFNYATMGQVFGHETGHVLYFHLRENNTYNETLQYFNGGLSCLEEQYSKFFIEVLGKHVRGNRTVTENFPDSLGLRVNEKIVMNYLANKTEKFYLPGLPYSAEELFYIAYSQLWCAAWTKEKELFAYEKDWHSPPKFRVLGILQNSERFSQTFNCQPNSVMNPETKCSILDY